VIYAYTGDNTSKAIEEFKMNKMKGAFIKPVEPSLIAEFFKIAEINLDDSVQFRRLSIKKKNFIYFLYSLLLFFSSFSLTFLFLPGSASEESCFLSDFLFFFFSSSSESSIFFFFISFFSSSLPS